MQSGAAPIVEAKPASGVAPLGKAPLARVDAQSPYQTTIEWEIPDDAQPGTYRIVHRGRYKTEADRRLHEFEAHSRSFQVQ